MGYQYAEYGGFAPYVPVAERRRKAAREVASLRKTGKPVAPVRIDGRSIATTFWGQAWCANLEAYSDYANRLPRGRTYVRNGSVVDLQIAAGQLTALVMGSELYRVEVEIRPIAAAQWRSLIKECAGRIDSLIELLQGKLSQGVMEIITRKTTGLFPEPRQIKFSCSCPDSARLCKHVAAALYGVGARLDQEPELLFRLRHVDQLELITGASAGQRLGKHATASQREELTSELASTELSALFGIDLDPGDSAGTKESGKPDAPAARPGKSSAKKPVLPKTVLPKLRRAQVSRKELLARGIAPTTLQIWLRSGILIPSAERGIYKTTATARKWLAAWPPVSGS